MERDLQLGAAVRAIYGACYPSEDWRPADVNEAERIRSVHCRQATGAARQARVQFLSSTQFTIL